MIYNKLTEMVDWALETNYLQTSSSGSSYRLTDRFDSRTYKTPRVLALGLLVPKRTECYRDVNLILYRWGCGEERYMWRPLVTKDGSD